MKILDTWKVKSSYGVSKYYVFQNGDKATCVSKCVHNNGAISYCMSDEDTPLKLYGTQEEIKKIFEKIESENSL